MANLCKIGLKMRAHDVSENLAPILPSKGGAMSLAPLPPSPQESAPVLAMNGSLPAELKFRGNNVKRLCRGSKKPFSMPFGQAALTFCLSYMKCMI